MRKLIPALAILAATSVQAAELKFGDLNYKMTKGEQNFQFGFSPTYDKQTVMAESLTRGYLVESKYSYAVANRLDAFAALDYVWDEKTENTGAASNTISSFKNPVLGVNYRVFAQKDFDYNFDIEALTRLSLFDAEPADNKFDGRTTVEIKGSFGRKWNEANEWKASLGLVHNLKGELKDSGNKLDEKSSTDLVMSIAYQYRPINEFMIGLAAEATQYSSYEVDDMKAEEHMDYKFSFSAKYLITESLIGKFNYSVSRLNEYDLDTPGATETVSGRHSNIFGLGVDYLF